MRCLCSVLALCVTLGGVARLAAEEPPLRELTVGLSQPEFTAEFEKRTGAGFRPVELSVAAANRAYVFSVLWEKRATPQFFVQPGFTNEQFLAKNTELEEQGFILVYLGNVYGSGVKHQAIWEQKNGPDLELALDLAWEEFEKAHAEKAKQGFRLRELAAAAGPETPRFSAVWEESEGPPQEFDHDVAFSRVRRVVTRRERNGFRCTRILGTEVDGRERYTLVWEKAQGPPQQIQARMTAETLEKERKQWEGDNGYRIRTIDCYNVRELPRYAVVWEGPAEE